MGTALYRSRGCFGCGTENASGLGLAPERDGALIHSRFVPRPEHRGFARAVHGGITATALDEIVGLACSQRVDRKCATVELKVRFRRPLVVAEEVRIEARYLRRQGPLLLATGRVLDGKGRVLATATGKFLPLDEKQLERFVEK